MALRTAASVLRSLVLFTFLCICCLLCSFLACLHVHGFCLCLCFICLYQESKVKPETFVCKSIKSIIKIIYFFCNIAWNKKDPVCAASWKFGRSCHQSGFEMITRLQGGGACVWRAPFQRSLPAGSCWWWGWERHTWQQGFSKSQTVSLPLSTISLSLVNCLDTYRTIIFIITIIIFFFF